MHTWIVKNISSSSNSVLIQIIQFRVSTVSMSKTDPIQRIHFSIEKQFHFKRLSLAWLRNLNVKTVLSQTIQFSISTQFSSIRPIDRTLSGATILGQSEPGSNGNEGLLRIRQRPSISGISPSDCVMSYPGHSLKGSYPSTVKQSVYSITPKPTGQYLEKWKILKRQHHN